MSTPPQYYYPYQPPPPPIVVNPALLGHRGLRLLARVIDLVIVAGMAFGLGNLGERIGNEPEISGVEVLFIILIAALWLAYEPLFVALFGWTPGKRLCRLRVAQLVNGDPPSTGQAIGRSAFILGCSLSSACTFLPLMSLLDSLWCLWDKPNRQCLHDKVSKTVVVRTG